MGGRRGGAFYQHGGGNRFVLTAVEGVKLCLECQGTFMGENHSCIQYMQKLIRAIVGDLSYERASNLLNLEKNPQATA